MTARCVAEEDGRPHRPHGTPHAPPASSPMLCCMPTTILRSASACDRGHFRNADGYHTMRGIAAAQTALCRTHACPECRDAHSRATSMIPLHQPHRRRDSMAAHLTIGFQSARKRSSQSSPTCDVDHGDCPLQITTSSLPTSCSHCPVRFPHEGITCCSARSVSAPSDGTAPGSAQTARGRPEASTERARRRRRPATRPSMLVLKPRSCANVVRCAPPACA